MKVTTTYLSSTRFISLRMFFVLFTLFLFQSNAISQTWDEIVKSTASDASSSNYYGYSVSFSEGKAIVGAPNSYVNSSGFINAGSAYILEFNGTNWIEKQKIYASDAVSGDFFGGSVSISGDKAIIGARGSASFGSNTGAVYFFEFNGTIWVEKVKILASDPAYNDQFGYSVFMSGDRAIVGSYGNDDDGNTSGSAYIFNFNGTTWIEKQKITASDAAIYDEFGFSVSISGDKAIVGAHGNDDDGNVSGSAYVFEFDGTTWLEKQKITASDAALGDVFGKSVSISGNKAIVGAYGNDDVINESGSAYIFEFNGTAWVQKQKVTASDASEDSRFGKSVSISGDKAIIGAEGNNVVGTSSGSAYVFEFNGTTWVEIQKLIASDTEPEDFFGKSVSISDDKAIVGAWKSDDGGLSSGSAYIYEYCLTTASFSITGCSSYTVPSSDETYTTVGTYIVMDTISNLAGCDSIMTINLTIVNNMSNYSVIECESYTVPSGNKTYTTVGSYQVIDTINNMAGCDSIMTIYITIKNPIDNSTTISRLEITANQKGATYQWLDCNNNNSEINGETNNNFIVTSNGNYAVKVTIGACSEVSECVSITTVGINDTQLKVNNIKLHPNPTKENIILDIGTLKNVQVSVISITGKEVYNLPNVNKPQVEIPMANYNKGIYFVKIQNNNHQEVIKLLKK